MSTTPDNISGSKQLSTFRRWLSKRPVYHTLGWLAFTLFTAIINILIGQFAGKFTVEDAFIQAVVNSLYLLPIVYINYLFLIKQYLARNQFFIYLVMLGLTVMLVTPIKLLLIYLFSDDDTRSIILYNQWIYYIKAFVLAIGSTVVKIISDWIRQERTRRDLESQNLQAELRFLRSQINPHFLFNTLNSIYALSLKKSDDAPETVLRLSEMMRYMLYDSNEKLVALEKEVNYIKNYIELEQMRYAGKCDIQFNIDGDISEYMVAPHLFIHFVENSFKHGLSSNIQSGYVNIALKVKNKLLTFRIANSKTDLHDSIYHKGGIGIQNTRRRLDILYAGHYKLDINDTPEAYTLILTLNLNSYDPDTDR